MGHHNHAITARQREQCAQSPEVTEQTETRIVYLEYLLFSPRIQHCGGRGRQFLTVDILRRID